MHDRPSFGASETGWDIRSPTQVPSRLSIQVPRLVAVKQAGYLVVVVKYKVLPLLSQDWVEMFQYGDSAVVARTIYTDSHADVYIHLEHARYLCSFVSDDPYFLEYLLLYLHRTLAFGD